MGEQELVTVTPQGLYCSPGDFHVDPWQPVANAVLTHAHGDHARPGSGRYFCASAGASIVSKRLPEASIQPHGYGEPFELNGVKVSFHPAGHVLGSAQIRLEVGGEIWVVTGDYKRQPDPTCARFEPVRCDVLVTEATFGLPIFRWEEPERVVESLFHFWQAQRAEKRCTVVFCYALGKAQRILAELTRFTDQPVYVHGAIEGLTQLYREADVAMLPTLPVAETAKGKAFAGELVLAPPSARGTAWTKRFGSYASAYASGWMRIRGTRRRQGFDRGFVLSDHADWPALISTIEESEARRIRVTHGYREPLARYLRERGRDAVALETAFEGEVEA